MDVDAAGWSGEGDLTTALIEAIKRLPVRALKVEDAPASRTDAAFSFISNELFVAFDRRAMSLGDLERALSDMPGIGEPDYSDDGMLQYLRTERIIPPYQTKGYKLIELVRIYEAGRAPRREPG
jgi:hypothetical protein